jgi:glycosyltransferase involved in cell wall biosynthesis
MDRVICAVAALRSSHPDLHLLVIGEGPSRAALILLSQQLGIAEQVHFIGQQRMVQSWLRGGIELFVSGAREEAFGLVLAEAALAGIPVIAPKVGGIPEVLLHQDSALLYNSNQPEQMAYQITRLLNDKTEANALAESALQRVRQHFSLTENTRQLTRLYNQLLDNYPQWPPQPGLLSCLKPLKAISLSHLTN